METKEFEIKRKKWLQEVAEQCHIYATDKKYNLDKDFYVFQTNSNVYQPEILLIGINPGGSKSYKEALKEKSIETGKKIDKRTWDMLDSDPVTLYEKPNWEKDKGADYMRSKLALVFHNDELKEKLKNTVMINMLFINTRDSGGAYAIQSEIQKFCRKKVFEFIEISKPKNIIFFTLDKKKLGSHGVKNITQVEENINVFSGYLNEKKVFLIPHYNAREPYRYNKEVAQRMGDKLLEVLKK